MCNSDEQDQNQMGKNPRAHRLDQSKHIVPENLEYSNESLSLMQPSMPGK